MGNWSEISPPPLGTVARVEGGTNYGCGVYSLCRFVLKTCKRSAILKLCLNLSTRIYANEQMTRIFNAFAIFFQKTHTFLSSLHKKTKKVFEIRENLSNP